VSFIDSEGIAHSVEVSAASLYEAAALALAEFRRCGFTDADPGAATRLSVAVKVPATTHEVTVRKVRDWLDGAAKSPKELVLKNRLKALMQ
jgi:hypothetical protein